MLLITAGCGGGGTSSQPTLQSISVTPSSALVKVGETQPYSATGQFSDGSTTSLGSVSWTTDSPRIASVNGNGVATGVGGGTTKIAAAVQGVRGTASITVAAQAPPGNGGSGSTGVSGNIAYVATPSQNCNGNQLSPAHPNSVAVIDLDANSTDSAVIAHIAMPSGYIPNATAADDNTGKILVTSCSSPVIVIIDKASNQVVGSANAPITTSAKFSGATCMVCGVIFDLTTNDAILDTAQGYMTFDVASGTFSGPFPASVAGENFGYDPSSQVVLNPFYGNGSVGYQLIDVTAQSAKTFKLSIANPDAGVIDSLTHIGLITDEASTTELLLNLNFSPGSTPPSTTFAQGTTCKELTMAAIDSSVHAAVLAAEDSADCLALELLPVSAPAVNAAPPVPSAFIWGHMPQTPNGSAWHFGLDPHGLAVFTSLINGKHFAFVVDKNGKWVARIDLGALAGASPNAAGIDLTPYVTFFLVS